MQAQRTTRTSASSRRRLALLFLLTTLACRVSLADNVIAISHARGAPGDRNVEVIITARNEMPIHGYSLALNFPTEAFTVTSFGVLGTHIASLDPDLVAPVIDNGLGVATLGVIFNYDEPIGSDSFAATPKNGAPLIIARLTIDVKSTSPGGTHSLRLMDGIGSPAAFNRFTDAGVSVAPLLEPGTFFVEGGNVLSLDKRLAFPGSIAPVDIRARVLNPLPLDGFSVAVQFDCSALELVDDVTWTQTDVADVPDFFQTDVDDTLGNDECRSRTALIFDFPEPMGRLLPASPTSPQSILRYRFRADAGAAVDQEFQNLFLDNREFIGAINNVFVVVGESILPHRVHGKIYFSTGGLSGRVVEKITQAPVAGVSVVTDPDDNVAVTAADGTFQFASIIPGTYTLSVGGSGYYNEKTDLVTVSGDNSNDDVGTIGIYSIPIGGGGNTKLFRRGYVNADRGVNIADAIFLLDWLFRGGPAPQCELSADVNGDRQNNISDTVWLLNWLFTGGPPPPDPRLECGTDPTSRLTCNSTLICP